MREWFPVNVGLRHGCVMSPWLFNVYMDGAVREVNLRVLGKGLELLSANGGRFEINQLLFAGLRSAERRKVNVLEMKCLRSLVGVSRIDRVRIEEVRRRAGIERELASRAD